MDSHGAQPSQRCRRSQYLFQGMALQSLPACPLRQTEPTSCWYRSSGRAISSSRAGHHYVRSRAFRSRRSASSSNPPQTARALEQKRARSAHHPLARRGLNETRGSLARSARSSLRRSNARCPRSHPGIRPPGSLAPEGSPHHGAAARAALTGHRPDIRRSG